LTLEARALNDLRSLPAATEVLERHLPLRRRQRPS
jgi:hypothetical protein